jgi:hypothetical protein
MVKIFTMVKDEVDVVEDWLIYHGCLFGWENIYIIDNYSTDGTYEKIVEFKKSGPQINVFRENDYKNKGIYMKNLIDTYCTQDRLAFPIDIDEFVIYYERNAKEVIFDKQFILNYMNNLPELPLYKANYLYPLLANPCGSDRVQADSEYATYLDYGSHAKSFIDVRHFKGTIDHGNHIPSNNYLLTNIALIHFHSRNIEQNKKKTINNLVGLGYSLDLQNLKNIINSNPNACGNHHIRKFIAIEEKNFSLGFIQNPNPDHYINIKPFKQRIIDGFF